MKIHGTATGGALGKKDFGVAFGGGAAGATTYDTECYTNNDDDRDSDQIATRSGSRREWGGLAIVADGALKDKYATKIRFKLHASGAVTGNLVGQIRSGVTTSSEGTNQLTSSNTIDLDDTDIQSDTTFQEFEFDGSYKFGTNSNEAILIYWASDQSNGSATIWLALRWKTETSTPYPNVDDVISTTNDGTTGNTNFEFWTNENTNMNITYTS